MTKITSWFCLALVVGGCVAPNNQKNLATARIYERAGRTFERAALYKPAETNIDEFTLRLAPLILQEVSGADTSAGLLNRPSGSELESGQAVYYLADAVELGGRTRARMTYIWFYAATDNPGALSVQGVRLTLDASGRPALWEALADETGLDLVFVARSVEDAATAQFRKPLPGRRYATERGSAEAPRTVVARIIEDGPVPMGPIVYLSAANRSISTLICRCMPAQARTLSQTTVYDLRPWPRRGLGSLIRRSKALAREHFAFWPDDARVDGDLERRLRLPAGW